MLASTLLEQEMPKTSPCTSHPFADFTQFPLARAAMTILQADSVVRLYEQHDNAAKLMSSLLAKHPHMHDTSGRYCDNSEYESLPNAAVTIAASASDAGCETMVFLFPSKFLPMVFSGMTLPGVNLSVVM